MEFNIFHTGDLNSGISRAIQESKVVLCLIRADEDHDSEVWENYWLGSKSQPTDMFEDSEPPLGLILGDKAVLLRINQGSQEAQFLNAFCQIKRVPTIAVIQNGSVLDKLEGDVSKEEFRERLLKACGFMDSKEEEPGADAVSGGQSEEVSDEMEPMSEDATPADVQALLSERAQRLEAGRQKREAAEKAERAAREKARQKQADDATASQSGQRPGPEGTRDREKRQARDAWIYQQKQRKDEAKKERERILNQIESDKQERKLQKERAREAQSAGGDGALSSMPSTDQTRVGASVTSNISTSCALQIRLFDGSSIRGKFASDTTLALAVRTWVKEASPEGGADIPYTFRQILAPQPSRSIEVSEEHQSLWELGLTPNATLVLVPIAGYTAAYANPNNGYLSSAWNFAYGCASTAGGMLGSVVSFIPGVGRLYMGGISDERENSNVVGAHMAGADSAPTSTPVPGVAAAPGQGEKIKVKTLFDQRAEQGRKDKDKAAAEFYNGNSSAFEGRGSPGHDDSKDE